MDCVPGTVKRVEAWAANTKCGLRRGCCDACFGRGGISGRDGSCRVFNWLFFIIRSLRVSVGVGIRRGLWSLLVLGCTET